MAKVADSLKKLSWIQPTRHGPLRLEWTPEGLWKLELPEGETEPGASEPTETPEPRPLLPQWMRLLVARLEVYFEGGAVDFRDVPVDMSGYSDFTRQVLEEARHLSYGETCVYRDLAMRIGKPKALRAVGQALGFNRTPLVIPCHRVISSNGSLGGFTSKRGVVTKGALLELEGSLPYRCLQEALI